MSGVSQSDVGQSLQDELREGAVLAEEVLLRPARNGDSENAETIIHSIITGSARHSSQ